MPSITSTFVAVYASNGRDVLPGGIDVPVAFTAEGNIHHGPVGGEDSRRAMHCCGDNGGLDDVSHGVFSLRKGQQARKKRAVVHFVWRSCQILDVDFDG
ncbi:MAG: hypothetical protein WAM66_12810 [Acidobacteriaceae bacterium]